MSSLIRSAAPLGAGRSARSIVLPDGQFSEIVIESLGALFILNRLMMKELNEVAYQTIDRSRLFKLCDSMDETETSIHYGSSGFPIQSIREAPHARI